MTKIVVYYYNIENCITYNVTLKITFQNHYHDFNLYQLITRNILRNEWFKKFGKSLRGSLFKNNHDICSIKKVLLTTLQNSKENTCVGFSFRTIQWTASVCCGG